MKPRSEKAIQAGIRKALEADGWLVAKTHGGRFMKGWPDLWCCHPEHGYRWIEVKRPKGGKLTDAQARRFPEWDAFGVKIWILTDEEEIPLLWKAPNWKNWA